MNSSKLLELYKTLQTIEKRRFTEYVESPFFNSNTYVIQLNKYIVKNLDSGTEEHLNKNETFIHLFGKEKFDKQKVSTIMTFLMSHLEDFISYLKIEKNKFLQKEYLLIALRERNMGKHFLSNANEYTKQLEKKNINDSESFYERHVLERELDHYFTKNEARKSNESLQRKSDNLDTFFLSEKLKNLCEMVNRKNIIAANYNLNMLEEILAYINANIKNYRKIPSVYIYYKILLTLLEPLIPEHFKELKQALDKHFKEFSKDEALQMYLFAQNYCIKKLNSGEQEYLHDVFSIYESLLTSEIIFEENHLSQWDYKNIVSAGLKLEKFDWTKKFIEQYKERLAPEFRENAYEYNLASFYFNKQDYKSALKLLQRVDFTDVYYHLSAKFMLLKMYYELDEVESFYSLTDAYKVYLVRNKNISVYQRQVHQKLVKFTKKAFDLKLKASSTSAPTLQKAIKKLQSQINPDNNDTNQTWLQERIAELVN